MERAKFRVILLLIGINVFIVAGCSFNTPIKIGIKQNPDSKNNLKSAENGLDLAFEYAFNLSSGDSRRGGLITDEDDNVYIGGYYTIDPHNWTMFYYVFDKQGNQLQYNNYSHFSSYSYYNYSFTVGGYITRDSESNIFLLGYEGSSLEEMYLVKYNQTGDLQWERVYDSYGDDIPYSIAVDSDGAAYIVGETEEPGLGKQLLVVKYNALGTQQWNFTWGGSDSEWGYDIVVSEYDNIYIAAQSVTYSVGSSSIWIMELSQAGTLMWSNEYEGSPDHDRPTRIALDSNLNIYVLGGLDYGGGSTDIWTLIKFNSIGNYIWNVTYLGEFDAGADPWTSDMIIRSDQIYVLVKYGHLSKFNIYGDLLWTINLPDEVDHATRIAVDSEGSLYVTSQVSNYLVISKYSSKPSITIYSPTWHDAYSTQPPSFNISVFEPDLELTWYSIDGGITNITFVGSIGIIEQDEWDKYGDDEFINIWFYADDINGYLGFKNITVYKDTSAPYLSILDLVNDSDYYESNPPNYTIHMSGSNRVSMIDIDNCWYMIVGLGTTIILYSEYGYLHVNGTIDKTLWENAPLGELTIRFFINDTCGNIRTYDITVIKIADKAEPISEGIPSYNLFIIISILSISSLFLVKKKIFKKSK